MSQRPPYDDDYQPDGYQPQDHQDPTNPDRRALDAMAAAVRRARRENSGGLHRQRHGDRSARRFTRQEPQEFPDVPELPEPPDLPSVPPFTGDYPNTPDDPNTSDYSGASDFGEPTQFRAASDFGEPTPFRGAPDLPEAPEEDLWVDPDELWNEPDYTPGSGTSYLSDDDDTWHGQYGTRGARRQRSHATTRLGIAAGAVLAVLIAIAAVAYWPSGSPSTAVLDRTHVTTPKAHAPSTAKHRPKSTTTAPSTTSPTTASPTTTSTIPPSGLHISTLIPSRGGPGQLVMVRGGSLFSPDGQVVVEFNGESVPTDCTTTSICTATVPDLGTSGTVQVTVVTQAGTSNGLSFTYTK